MKFLPKINKSNFRSFIERNKLYFETFGAIILAAAAIFVSILQYNTTAKQTELIKIQSQLAQYQVMQQHRDAAILKAKDWATLRILLLPMVNKYDDKDLSQLKGINNFTREEKIRWYHEMDSLLTPIGTNQIIIASKHNYLRYLSMLSDINLGLHLMDADNNPEIHKFFYMISKRIGKHLLHLWIDLGMIQNSRNPDDSIYNPTPQDESFFTKGFPWESIIHSKDSMKSEDIILKNIK
jgi:hypothetical protein